MKRSTSESLEETSDSRDSRVQVFTTLPIRAWGFGSTDTTLFTVSLQIVYNGLDPVAYGDQASRGAG